MVGLMPNNEGLNYMVATTCKWQNSGSKWHINSAKIVTTGERVWVMQDSISAYQCKRNISIIKISIDLWIIIPNQNKTSHEAPE